VIAGIRLHSGPRRGSSHEGQRDMGAQRLRPRLTTLAATAAFLVPVLASQPALGATSGSSQSGPVSRAATTTGLPATFAGIVPAIGVRQLRLASQSVPGTSQIEAGGQDQPSPAPASTRLARTRLPTTGFDGMLVAAVGVALTGLGWLLLLASGRRYRRRSR
jgi:LPXTG-motif cell wall-anchored protein